MIEFVFANDGGLCSRTFPEKKANFNDGSLCSQTMEVCVHELFLKKRQI